MGKQRTGDEHIMFDGMPIGHLLGDYWARSEERRVGKECRL